MGETTSSSLFSAKGWGKLLLANCLKHLWTFSAERLQKPDTESLAEGLNTPLQSGGTSTVVKSESQRRGSTGKLKKGTF